MRNGLSSPSRQSSLRAPQAVPLFAAVILFATQNTTQAMPIAPGVLAAGVTSQGFGTIKGRLVFDGANVPAPKVSQKVGLATKDPEVCAAKVAILDRDVVVDPKTKGIANGFAYLVRPTAKNPEAVKALVAKQPKAVLDQLNCEFQPFVLAIHQDQTLVLKSSDPVAHNVRLAGFANAGLNQNLPPKGSLEVKLKAERFPVQVACDIHPWMHSYLMVFDHPFFAVTAADGSFEIKGVPAGTQKFVLRQEKVGYVTAGKGSGIPVVVTADQVTDLGEIKLDGAKLE